MSVGEFFNNVASKVKTVAYTFGIGVAYYAQKGLKRGSNSRRNSTDSNTTFVANANFGKENNEVESNGVENPEAQDFKDDISEASNVTNASEFDEFDDFDEDENEGYLDVEGAENDSDFEGFEASEASEDTDAEEASNEALDTDDAAIVSDEGNSNKIDASNNVGSLQALHMALSTTYLGRLTDKHREVLNDWNAEKITDQLDEVGEYEDYKVVGQIIEDLNKHDLLERALPASEQSDNKVACDDFSKAIRNVYFDTTLATIGPDELQARRSSFLGGEYFDDEFREPVVFDGVDGDDDNYLSLEEVQKPIKEHLAGGGGNDGAPAQEDEDPYLSQSSLLPKLNKNAAAVVREGMEVAEASKKGTENKVPDSTLNEDVNSKLTGP